jgi:RNA polymerase sigma-70 factor (ECF subfamily)
VRVTTPLGDVEDFLTADTTPPDDGLDLTRALASLPPRQRALVEDVKITGHSLSEAGGRAGMSEGAAKVALHRALKLLAGRMRSANA